MWQADMRPLTAYKNATMLGMLEKAGIDPATCKLAMPFWSGSAGDHSGNGNDGTLQGGAYIDADGVLQLDGDGDYVRILPDTFQNKNIISVWFKTDDLSHYDVGTTTLAGE